MKLFLHVLLLVSDYVCVCFSAWRTQFILLLHAPALLIHYFIHINIFILSVYAIAILPSLSAFSISYFFISMVGAFVCLLFTSFLIILTLYFTDENNKRMIILRCAYRTYTCAMKFAAAGFK